MKSTELTGEEMVIAQKYKSKGEEYGSKSCERIGLYQ